MSALSCFLRKIPFRGFAKIFDRKIHSKVNPTADNKCLDVPEGEFTSCYLKNNMKLICEHKEDSCITAIGCFLPAGSIHEYPEERGASLFMEHLLFRKTRCKNADNIDEELGKIGAKLTAIAMRDVFLFYGTVPSTEVGQLMELMAESVFDGVICEEDVEKEKSVVLRCLKDMEKDFETVAMDYLPTIAYQGTELSRSVYPETEVIKCLTAEQISSFRTRMLKPCKMTMICTGGTSFDELQSLAEKYFIQDDLCDPCNTSEDISLEHVYPESLVFRYTGCEMRHRDDDQELGYVALAVEGPGHNNCEDFCALTVAKELVGHWSMADAGFNNNAPRIAQSAFGTDLCRLYKSFNIGYHCTGLWGCYFVCEKMQLENMAWNVQTEWMRLCTSITSKEVQRAVNRCKTLEILNVQTPDDRFLDIAMCVHHRGDYQTFNERLARYDGVTLDVLRNVADKYLYDQCPVIVALGRIENLPDYNFLRTYMYQLRR